MRSTAWPASVTWPGASRSFYALQELAARKRWATEGELTAFPEAILIEVPSKLTDDGDTDTLSVDGEEKGTDDDAGADELTTDGDSPQGMR